MMRTSLVVLMSLGLVCSEPGVSGDVGSWSVGDCFMAEFSLGVEANTTLTKQTSFVVPKDAKANTDQSNCANETNTLTLTWSETALNDTKVNLDRKLVLTFKKDTNATMYGVHMIVGRFEIAHYETVNETSNVTEQHVSFLETTWQGPLMFRTPLDRSFFCFNINTVSLKTSHRIDDRFAGKVLNSTLTGSHVIFDAFRPKDNVPSGFRTPMDCDYRPNDIIPIAVGVALATLVVAVLVAYMVGRRRNMQRGYQSV